MKTPDYFSAKEAVERLEKALSRHLITPPEDITRPAGEHVVDLGVKGTSADVVPKESLADFVVRRRNEMEAQLEELAFLQDVAVLMQKHPRFFDGSK